MIQRYWTKAGQTQQQIKLAVTEAMRGGFFVHVTYVRENRAYLESRKVSVPWKNKDLDLKWEHFVSKLQPGQKETWTLTVQSLKSKVQSPKSEVRSAEKAVAEMVATLYDESLDAFAPLNWPQPVLRVPRGLLLHAVAVRQYAHGVPAGLRKLGPAVRGR